MKKFKNLFFNLILPGILLPGLVGLLAGSVTIIYKWASEELNEVALKINDCMTTHYWSIPIVIVSVIAVAFIQSIAVKKVPIAKGGGIPTSEGIIRGSLEFNPLLSLIFTTLLSFVSFLIGLPLGSEGPSVAIGTALGSLSAKICPNREKTYSRYLMTAGASASFGVATGSPIAGIIFAFEEIHRRFTPLLLIVSFSSVVMGSLMARILANPLDISYRLFNEMTIPQLELKDYWYLIPIGIIIGVLAIGFNYLIKLSQRIQDKRMSKVPVFIKISISFVLTIVISIFVPEVLNGGSHLVLGLFDQKFSLLMLSLLLVLKVLMVAWISQSGVTGGMFIPVLTIGALIGAILAKLFNMGEHSVLVVTIAMAAFMGASIGCPLSALVFSFEALSATPNNILAFAIVLLLAYFITRIFNSTHIYDVVLERKLHLNYNHRNYDVVELQVKVNDESFAQNRQVRDLLLSANMIVIAIKRKDKRHYKMDNFGDKVMRSGDEVTLRCQTYDINKTKEEIESFFGSQPELSEDVVQTYRKPE